MYNYVKDAGLKFRKPLKKRKKTTRIVLHHLAGWGSVEQVHKQELADHDDWAGIGYNVYVRLDGTMYWGRGMDKVGAHCGVPGYAPAAENNSASIGIGFEGYYHPGPKNANKKMPKAQYDAGVKLIRDILKQYKTIKEIKGHREMPGCKTACPGDYFPLADMVRDAMGQTASGGTGTGGGVDYTRVIKLTSPNMRGEDVEAVQRTLIATGANITADGIFGPKSREAVVAFQRKKGLSPDGVVGKATVTALGGEWAG